MRRSDPEALTLFSDPTGAAIDYEADDAPVSNLDEWRSKGESGHRDTPGLSVADSSEWTPEGSPGDYDA